MSKELEMLREMAKQFAEIAPFVRCPKCDTAQEVYTHIDDRMVNAADLRRILARLEAAERVADVVADAEIELRDDHIRVAQIDYEQLANALRAYRALDTKEPT